MDYVVANMREADKAECEVGGVTPEQAIKLGVERSHPCFSILWEDECLGIIGANRVPELDTAFIWFLGTPRSVAEDINAHWFSFAPHMIEELRGELPVTSCASIRSNVVHHAWLLALGYSKQAYATIPEHYIFTKEHVDV
jgi:hypothetical protein